eukprot:13999841-Ditylum_brightwellii.AAC.1
MVPRTIARIAGELLSRRSKGKGGVCLALIRQCDSLRGAAPAAARRVLSSPRSHPAWFRLTVECRSLWCWPQPP